MTVTVHYVAPLQYPSEYTLVPPHSRRHDHGFPADISIDKALVYLEEELQQLKVDTIRVYSSYEHIKNERTRKRITNDSAVCCELVVDRKSYFMLSDKWFGVEHNLYALHLTIRHMRMVEKWGVSNFVHLLGSFSKGTKNVAPVSAGAPGNFAAEWMQILGLGPTATLEDANATYRSRAKIAAQRGEDITDLNHAIEEARKNLSGAA